MRRFGAVLIIVFAAVCANSAGPANRLNAQIVHGTVRDAVANRPIRDAIVQLVSLDASVRQARSTHSDSLGRYEFSDVARGRYLIGFIHPLLDSLGVPPVANEVAVENEPVVINLATPEPARLRSAFCGPAADSGAVVLGVLRDARHEPIGGATVSAEWMELSVGVQQTRMQTARRTATSLANGWFFVCNVPSAGTVFLTATRASDTTDAVEITIPKERLAHRDLYLGAGATARVRGVVTGPDNEPIANAVIRVTGASEVHANARGEWTLRNAPGGTRTIEFRAIGYFPQRLSVDLVDDAPTMHVSLPTMSAMLDTVRIRAARTRLAGANGFEQRRRSALGHFFTAEDVVKIAPRETSDLFWRVPGVIVDRSSYDTFLSGTAGGPHQLTMPGTFAARCSPSVFVDGAYLGDLDADDIDSFVSPAEIAGVEVYNRPPLPQQFDQANIGALGPHGARRDPCGGIVIWTNPSHGPPMTWHAFAGKVLGLSAIVAAISYFSFR